MKSPTDQLASKAGGVAGFLAMAVVGWNLSGGPAETIGESPTPPVTRASRERPSKPPGIRDAAVAKLLVIRNAGNPAERMRATIDLANSLPLSEFGKWLGGGWFDVRDGAELALFTEILRERWWREDPEGFVLWSIKNDSRHASSMLLTWAEEQPQQVIDFFKRHPDNLRELEALAGMAKTHPDLALQRLLEMNTAALNDHNIYYGDDLFLALAEKSPAALEAALDSLKDPMRKRAEKILIEQKFKADYAGVLGRLLAQPDGFDVYYEIASAMDGMLGKIFDDLAKLPPEWRERIAADAGNFIDADSAEKWWHADLAAAGFSESEVNDLRVEALQQMAAKNPEISIERMDGLTFFVGESAGGYSDDRWIIIDNALTAHPEKTEELIALLPNKKDRNVAREVLERIKVENDRKAADKIETPEQWVEKVVSIDPEARYEYSSMLRRWDAAKLTDLGGRFRAMPDEQKQQVAQVIAYGISGGDFNPPLVGEAIRYLLNRPSGTPVANPDEPINKIPWLREASKYAGNLAVTEPETAGDWVQTLPEGEPKLWAQLNLHSIWSQYDPKAADRWFKTLPASVQVGIQEIRGKEK
jgi:hypothetical protein